jgi:PAS domain S-box-containing protein
MGEGHDTEQVAYHAHLLENMADAVLATDEDFVLTAWNRAAEEMFGWSANEALGKIVYELLHPIFSEQELAAGMARLAETGRWQLESAWHDKDGVPVHADALAVALPTTDDGPGGYLCIMRDVGERDRARHALETRAREQSLLVDVSMRALGTDHLESLMNDAVTLVARILEVEFSWIGEVDESANELRWLAAAGAAACAGAIVGAQPEPLDPGSLAGYALAGGDPVISSDLAADPRFGPSPLPVEPQPASVAAVVMPGERAPFGVLVAASRSRRPFSEQDINFMQGVANILGIAVERSRSQLRLEEAREGERRRIARDLHDGALRDLTDALAVGVVARQGARTAAEARRWGTRVDALERVIRQLRGSIYDLRLTGEEEGDFVDLLIDLVAIQDAIADGSRVELHGREMLPHGALGRRGVECLQIAREAITNARRHSGGTLVVVDAGGSTVGSLELRLSDEGAWPTLDRDIASPRSAGIASMRERAAMLQADLRIAHSSGGSEVRLRLALDQEARAR